MLPAFSKFTENLNALFEVTLLPLAPEDVTLNCGRVNGNGDEVAVGGMTTESVTSKLNDGERGALSLVIVMT